MYVDIVLASHSLPLAAFPDQDFNFTTRIVFTDVETVQSLSSNDLVVSIINDDIAEPFESFICTLQGGGLDAVRDNEPNQVTIRICDDDSEHIDIHVYACVVIYNAYSL